MSEVLRIKTEGKSAEFLQVLEDFKKHLTKNNKTARGYLSSFMQGVFFYDNANYRYINNEEFHRLAVSGGLMLEKYEYIYIEYKD
tara:strand:+ start:252 stop:506 length:255 start_codon:yes stop_codon:yes gene_type:complete